MANPYRAVAIWLLAGLLALAAAQDPTEAGVVHRGLVYGEVAGEPVRLDLYLPAAGQAPHPWLVRYSSAIERPDPVVRALLAAGYAVALADHGTDAQVDPAPPWPQFPTMVRRGVRWLRAHATDYGLDPVRGGSFGWSRGGASAMLAASAWWNPRFHDGSNAGHSDRLAAVIAIAGDFGVVPGDLRGGDLATQPPTVPIPADDPLPRRLRSVAPWLTPAMPPTLLIRGGRDSDPADAIAVHRGLAALGVTTELWIDPNAGHGVTGAEAQRRVVAWADAHIRTATAASIDRPMQPLPAAIALHRIGWHDAAEQVLAALAPGPLAEADAAALRQAELAKRLADLQTRSAGHHGVTPMAAALARLRTLADAATLTEPEAEFARRRDRAAVQAEAIRVRAAGPARPWPDGVAVPAWAAAHGSDGFGAWAELRLAAPHGEAVQRFRWCPPGSARLGTEPGSWGRIAPEDGPREIAIARGFWLGETEVTQACWRAVTGTEPSYATGDGRRPVERVNHAAAEGFTAALRALRSDLPVRLPLRDEWLWAARCGGEATALFGASDDLDAVGWWSGSSGGTTHPVAGLLPNAWGIHDLQGNVFEWLGDPRRERPLHYRFYAGGAYAASAERCRPESLGADNGANATPYLGLRLLVESGG
jgi:formylglycine-generating enzyme required for sulfatase activity